MRFFLALYAFAGLFQVFRFHTNYLLFTSGLQCILKQRFLQCLRSIWNLLMAHRAKEGFLVGVFLLLRQVQSVFCGAIIMTLVDRNDSPTCPFTLEFSISDYNYAISGHEMGQS